MQSPEKTTKEPQKTSPKSTSKRKSPKKAKATSPIHYKQSPYTYKTPKREYQPQPEVKIKRLPNEINKFSYIYSPRTTFSNQKAEEDQLFNDLSIGFDPITIKIIKKHFKERLGSLNKTEFIGILKNHLLSWHPELPDRQNILIKLLAKLFGEIDLNNNGSMEWDEFTNYIIHSSNKATLDNITYKLKHYSYSRNTIDDSEYTDIISYAFYIEKFNLVGLVQESRSVIYFYDGTTCKKSKAVIDIKETQREIDEIEIKELDGKAEEMVKREEEEKKKKRLKHAENYKKLINEFSNNSNGPSRSNSGDIRTEKKKQEKRVATPEKLKKELKRIKHENYSSLKNAVNKKLTILSTVFIPEFDTLLISSSNNKISAWKYSNGDFKNANTGGEHILDKKNISCAILTTDVPQYTLTWDPIQQYLYSGQADGKILKWKLTRNTNLESETLDFTKAKTKHDIEVKRASLVASLASSKKNNPSQTTINTNFLITTMNESDNKKANILKKEMRKRDSVSCIVILGKLQLLAAGYFNGNIILWDTMLKDYRKFYTDQETGIYQIIYEPNRNLIFSCGFDHNIFIYDPYIDGAAVYKLLGHNSSINSVAVNPLENELISIDINGIIKIWDLNNYYNYQTINLNETFSNKKVNNDIQNSKKKKISSNLKMIILTKINKILTYGDKFELFEKDTSLNPDLCDDQIVLGCSYNSISYEITSVCLKKIKIWNVFNGKVKKVYDDPMGNEITSYVFDASMKRIYLGDNTGRIKNFNMSHGNYLKDFAPHSKEICNLAYSDKNALLISLSEDQVIKFHEDAELLETTILKEINLSQMNVKTIATSEAHSRMLIGLGNGTLKFYDIEHFRFDSEVETESEKKFYGDPIVKITPMGDYELAFVSHESGKGKFMIIPPNGYKNFSFGVIDNILQKEEYTLHAMIIAIAFDLNHKFLLCGDVFGYVHCYDIQGIFTSMEATHNEIVSDTLKLFEELTITQKFFIQSNKEPVKNIFVPSMKPSVFITTSNDRKVKLFKSETGEYIDELRQIANKYKDIPIGVKYYIADPLQSKRTENEVMDTGIVYRKDIEGFHPSVLNRAKLKYEASQINEYAKLITEQNAKEKLFFATRYCDIDIERSNRWNLQIDLDFVINEEKEYYNEIFEIVRNNSERLQKEEALSHDIPIWSTEYRPYFIESMPDEKVKEFSALLSQKLRHAKLSMAKVKLDKNKYAEFEEENNRKKNISIKASMEMLSDAGMNKRKKLEPIKEIKGRMSLNCQRKVFKNVTERFENYKEDFDKKISDLEVTIEERLKRKMNKFILPKIKKVKITATEPNE